MDCFHPLTITNPNEYARDNGYPTVLVPCGKCESCIVSGANEWRVRLHIENDCSDLSYFLTLTYDESHLPIQECTDSFGDSISVPVVCKRDIQLFLKRLRKLYYDSKIRYFLVSEYCPTTLRPHYHCLLFGLSRQYKDNIKQTIKDEKRIGKCWSCGFVTLDKVTNGRIAYCTKYLSCLTVLPEFLPKPFRLMSRKPGLGAVYMDNPRLVDWHRLTLANYYPSNGFKMRLPRYLKDKLFDDEMKDQIKENIDQYRKDKFSDDIKLANELGYESYVDFRHQSLQRQIYKFNQKYVKNRNKIL